jgi:uncharacterized C2H2 Zn-finger protein
MAEIHHIVEWQKAISPDRGNDEPLVANLYKACSDLYHDILEALSKNASLDQAIILDLRRSYSYLVLWADGYSVSSGALDASLDKSKRAKRSTIRLLFSICQTVSKRLFIILNQNDRAKLDAKANTVAQAADRLKYLVQQDNSVDSDSDSSSDSSSDAGASDLEEIADDLRTDTECLLDLGSRFKENTVGPVIAETAVDPSLLSTWDPSNNFVDRIRWRFPSCEAKLAERLGKANWARVIRCNEAKSAVSHQHQASLTSQSKAMKPAATIGSSRGDASTAFQDSALGSSVPSAPSLPAATFVASPGSAYAETMVSYRGGQGDIVRIPSLPQGPLAFLPFPCVGCGESVRMVNKSAWKKHLFLDLQPYVCVFMDCNQRDMPFATKNEWENHVAQEHDLADSSQELCCPVCQDQSLTNPIKFRTHLARHLEEISLTILPTNPDSEDGTDLDSGLASDISDDEHTMSPSEDTLDRVWLYILQPLIVDKDFRRFGLPASYFDNLLHPKMHLRDVETHLMSMARELSPKSDNFQSFGLALMETIRKNLDKFDEPVRVPRGQPPYDEKYFINATKAVHAAASQIRDEENPSFNIAAAYSASHGFKRLSPLAPPPGTVAPSKEVKWLGWAQLVNEINGLEPGELDSGQAIRDKKQYLEAKQQWPCTFPGCSSTLRGPHELKRHEEGHVRTWKCPIPTCKYYRFGMPSEKERDRHVADKHFPESDTFFECQFKPCSYKSKRKSNCNQHMERVHGWVRERPKPDGKNPSKPSIEAAETESAAPPGSEDEDTTAVETSSSHKFGNGLSAQGKQVVCEMIIERLFSLPSSQSFVGLLDEVYRCILSSAYSGYLRDVERMLIFNKKVSKQAWLPVVNSVLIRD